MKQGNWFVLGAGFLSLAFTTACSPNRYSQAEGQDSTPKQMQISAASGIAAATSKAPACGSTIDARNGLQSIIQMDLALANATSNVAIRTAATTCAQQAKIRLTQLAQLNWPCADIPRAQLDFESCYDKAKSLLLVPAPVLPPAPQPVPQPVPQPAPQPQPTGSFDPKTVFQFRYFVLNTLQQPGDLYHAVVDFRYGTNGTITVPTSTSCQKTLNLTVTQRANIAQELAAGIPVPACPAGPADAGEGNIQTNFERSDALLLKVCGSALENDVRTLMGLARATGNEICGIF